MSQKLVKFGDVDSAVPAGTPRLTPAERKQQLEERLATYLLRFRTNWEDIAVGGEVVPRNNDPAG